MSPTTRPPTNAEDTLPSKMRINGCWNRIKTLNKKLGNLAADPQPMGEGGRRTPEKENARLKQSLTNAKEHMKEIEQAWDAQRSRSYGTEVGGRRYR